jgi:hypothetical protein
MPRARSRRLPRWPSADQAPRGRLPRRAHPGPRYPSRTSQSRCRAVHRIRCSGMVWSRLVRPWATCWAATSRVQSRHRPRNVRQPAPLPPASPPRPRRPGTHRSSTRSSLVGSKSTRPGRAASALTNPRGRPRPTKAGLRPSAYSRKPRRSSPAPASRVANRCPISFREQSRQERAAGAVSATPTHSSTALEKPGPATKPVSSALATPKGSEGVTPDPAPVRPVV